ncbi:MAG: hypothetical protein MJ252_02135 [archaeon]|nr:hypothetical protein [archaeon]
MKNNSKANFIKPLKLKIAKIIESCNVPKCPTIYNKISSFNLKVLENMNSPLYMQRKVNESRNFQFGMENKSNLRHVIDANVFNPNFHMIEEEFAKKLTDKEIKEVTDKKEYFLKDKMFRDNLKIFTKEKLVDRLNRELELQIKLEKQMSKDRLSSFKSYSSLSEDLQNQSRKNTIEVSANRENKKSRNDKGNKNLKKKHESTNSEGTNNFANSIKMRMEGQEALKEAIEEAIKKDKLRNIKIEKQRVNRANYLNGIYYNAVNTYTKYQKKLEEEKEKQNKRILKIQRVNALYHLDNINNQKKEEEKKEELGRNQKRRRSSISWKESSVTKTESNQRKPTMSYARESIFGYSTTNKKAPTLSEETALKEVIPRIISNYKGEVYREDENLDGYMPNKNKNKRESTVPGLKLPKVTWSI